MKFRRTEKRLRQRVAPPFDLRPMFNLFRILNISEFINPDSTDLASLIVVNYRWNLAISGYVPLIGVSNRKGSIKEDCRNMICTSRRERLLGFLLELRYYSEGPSLTIIVP